ncbi:DUF1330 domain-containing protein [Actinoplanes oblitus]|uniref:DUF1330 domain-containing protein n=1 Tax=Actinoplanes oblitus TaxID=3040509 RepID=A0ABY8WA97_9ACTN|nr:DUF1330 domain-containing protein [Actinoplanes oblitus]WIM93314.1 DUF1330 domain-containing protein [Actinoplanes oblitus]
MTVYAIAQLTIHDRDGYGRYVAAFMPILQQYGGRLLVADEHPEIVEGQWDGDKVVVVAFPDRNALDAWANSAEYRQISKDRLAATDGVVLAVRGTS